MCSFRECATEFGSSCYTESGCALPTELLLEQFGCGSPLVAQVAALRSAPPRPPRPPLPPLAQRAPSLSLLHPSVMHSDCRPRRGHTTGGE